MSIAKRNLPAPGTYWSYIYSSFHSFSRNSYFPIRRRYSLQRDSRSIHLGKNPQGSFSWVFKSLCNSEIGVHRDWHFEIVLCHIIRVAWLRRKWDFGGFADFWISMSYQACVIGAHVNLWTCEKSVEVPNAEWMLGVRAVGFSQEHMLSIAAALLHCWRYISISYLIFWAKCHCMPVHASQARKPRVGENPSSVEKERYAIMVMS